MAGISSRSQPRPARRGRPVKCLTHRVSRAREICTTKQPTRHCERRLSQAHSGFSRLRPRRLLCSAHLLNPHVNKHSEPEGLHEIEDKTFLSIQKAAANNVPIKEHEPRS